MPELGSAGREEKFASLACRVRSHSLSWIREHLRLAQQGIEVVLKRLSGTPAASDDLGGPLKILTTPLFTPVLWRRVDYVTNVADLIGKLDQFRPRRQVGCVLDL